VSKKSEFINLVARKRDAYLRKLKRDNYKPVTISLHGRVINSLIQTIDHLMAFTQVPTTSELKELIPDAIEKLPEHRHIYARTILNAFIKYLGNAKALRKIAKVELKSLSVRKERARKLKHFASYLSDFRGLSPATIRGYRNEFNRLLDNKFGDKQGALSEITRNDVINHLVVIVQKGPRNRTHKAMLSNICNYLLWAGHTNENWAETIPKQKAPAARALHRYLPPEKIQKLLEAAKSHPKLGDRDYAMCLLMARLGLRSPRGCSDKIGRH